MPITSIVAAIDSEISKLERARASLTALDGRSGSSKVPVSVAEGKISATPSKKRVYRKLSVAARKRMAAGQRKRWAAVRAAKAQKAAG